VRLSILVLSVPSRLVIAPPLLGELSRQADGHEVEVLCLFDNKRRSVGAKRNALLDIARGEYLSFVDDDDWVSTDYVTELLEATRDNEADVVVFDHHLLTDAGTKLCQYGTQWNYSDSPTLYRGKPAHTHCWRTSLARQARFPEINFAEDSSWSTQLHPRVRCERRIERVLYFYRFSPTLSETRG
jgi:glycosyltransferase involved in cell wall biosynthesis